MLEMIEAIISAIFVFVIVPYLFDALFAKLRCK